MEVRINSNTETMKLVSPIWELNIDRKFYAIEILTCDDVNVNHYYSIKDIVCCWPLLLASSVHFITGHDYQGLQVVQNQRISSKKVISGNKSIKIF